MDWQSFVEAHDLDCTLYTVALDATCGTYELRPDGSVVLRLNGRGVRGLAIEAELMQRDLRCDS